MAHEFEELSGRILAAAVDVHKALGPGFLKPSTRRPWKSLCDTAGFRSIGSVTY